MGSFINNHTCVRESSSGHNYHRSPNTLTTPVTDCISGDPRPVLRDDPPPDVRHTVKPRQAPAPQELLKRCLIKINMPNPEHNSLMFTPLATTLKLTKILAQITWPISHACQDKPPRSGRRSFKSCSP